MSSEGLKQCFHCHTDLYHESYGNSFFLSILVLNSLSLLLLTCIQINFTRPLCQSLRMHNYKFDHYASFQPFRTKLSLHLSGSVLQNEMEKWRAYDKRVQEIEHGFFAPLVFSTSGGMGNTATVVYKRIATLHAEKFDKPYSKTIHWLRCRLNFSLLRSAIMCPCGSCSTVHHPSTHLNHGYDIDLVCVEGRVPSHE